MKNPCKIIPVLLVLCTQAYSQDAKPTIKHEPAPYVVPNSGSAMYHEYCAACHGADGTGHGPVAPALKTAPPDLTALSKKNGGKFPNLRISKIISGDDFVESHGSREMPTWGSIFHSRGENEVVKLRIYNLTNYLSTLQTK